jgi:hypothetical protein
VRVCHQFICPITQELLREPVIAEDGHTYEKEAIQNWLSKNQTSPLTRKQISPTKLIPNLVLKQLIEQWKEDQRKGKGKGKTDMGTHDDEEEEDQEENERWRSMDEEELKAVLAQESGSRVPLYRLKKAVEKERTLAGSRALAAGGEEEGSSSSEDAFGPGGWLAFAGAVAVVAGGVAWAASSSSSSNATKRKVGDEENSCMIS